MGYKIMIDYEKYAAFRDSRGMKDSDVAKRAGLYQSVFSDWKKKKSVPKLEKMQKIAAALDMDYFTFVGPIGKYSSLNPENPLLMETTAARPVIPSNVIAYAERMLKLSKRSQEELQNYLVYLETRENKQS